MILAWSLMLVVAGPPGPTPASELRSAAAPTPRSEAPQGDEARVAFVPNSDLRDPFAARRDPATRPATRPPSRTGGLKDPFSPEVLSPPARRRPAAVRATIAEGVLVDPFAARRGRQPPPRLSAELKDPFRRVAEQHAPAERGEAASTEAATAAAPTPDPSPSEAAAASERDGVVIQRPQARRGDPPPCPSPTPPRP